MRAHKCRLLSLCLASLMVSGCALDRRRRDRYLRAHPDMPANHRERFLDHMIAGCRAVKDAAGALDARTAA